MLTLFMTTVNGDLHCDTLLAYTSGQPPSYPKIKQSNLPTLPPQLCAILTQPNPLQNNLQQRLLPRLRGAIVISSDPLLTVLRLLLQRTDLSLQPVLLVAHGVDVALDDEGVFLDC